MDVVVTGIGLASALGNLEASWNGLLEARSSIRLYQPFLDLKPKPLALISPQPAELVPLTQQVVLEALQDAGLSLPLSDCGVVVGSSRGNQAEWEELSRQFYLEDESISLKGWLKTLPNAAAIATARLLQTRASVLSPMAACATGIWAIAQGCELIRSGQCQRVVAGAVEAAITPLTLTGFDRMGALAKAGCYPFDIDRQGLVLGEGGAVLVLESAALANHRGARIYGQVLGFGLTADGHHVSAPKQESKAAIAAVRQCLQRSQLSPQDIDYIHAHGTSTPLNDRNEAYLIQQLFPLGVPVSSTKGATGHTIGASGALGAAFCLMALQHQTLPPCVGLKSPEFDLDFVRTARSTAAENALCLSFGFGGQNAAIALRVDSD
ncbi:MAG: beta-ketoacyl-ACP synthase [Phormidesmis sp. CAN_BIN36]|nr:beta-ketoacyl-ACP synthase [Phormidesmis sp. CAN_BIN36]